MWRRVTDKLISWKHGDRKPLFVTGINGCGKTHVLRELGRTEFERFIEVRLDDEEIRGMFTSDPESAFKAVSERFGTPIDHDTLVILESVQLCPAATEAVLRIHGLHPDWALAMVSSLPGLVRTPSGSIPEGSVERVVVRPMDFGEFLVANGIRVYEDRSMAVFGDDVPEHIRKITAEHLKDFIIVGGMPEAVECWITRRDIQKVTEIQDRIIETNRNFLFDYAPISEFEKVRDIYRSIPVQLMKDNSRFRFRQVLCTDRRSKELGRALQWLVDGGMVIRSDLVSPGSDSSDGRSFKAYMADVGLLCRRCRLSPKAYYNGNLTDGMRSALSENFVATEIVAHMDCPLRYWRDGGKEVDFLIEFAGRTVPMEVIHDSGKPTGGLTEYMERHHPEVSMTVATESPGIPGAVNIPYHSVWMLDGIINALIGGA